MTGVQTCALPIWASAVPTHGSRGCRPGPSGPGTSLTFLLGRKPHYAGVAVYFRSFHPGHLQNPSELLKLCRPLAELAAATPLPAGPLSARTAGRTPLGWEPAWGATRSPPLAHTRTTAISGDSGAAVCPSRAQSSLALEMVRGLRAAVSPSLLLLGSLLCCLSSTCSPPSRLLPLPHRGWKDGSS